MSPSPRKARIIPAYAGSTGLCNLGPEAKPDHPRIRGEHSIVSGATWTISGSSPHTRGALVGGEVILGLIEDHPRIRGEHHTKGEVKSFE